MNVEIRTEAALFPEKEYISGIFLAMHAWAAKPCWRNKPVPRASILQTQPGRLISPEFEK